MNELIWWDIETPKGCFLLCALDSEGNKHEFRINQYQNDLYKLVRFINDHWESFWVGYNSANFDSQVVQFILNNYESWFDKTGIEIAAIISQFASDVIDDINHGVFPPYREWELLQKNIDVFKIQHFDNKNRRVGLKRLEFEMDMEVIEDMPVAVDKTDFTPEEVEDLVYYCWNDVYATVLNYKYITGDTNNPLYRGTNQITLRRALSKTFKFDATNYSNSKYGDEIIKTLYCKKAGIRYEQLPKKGTFRKNIRLKNCIPEFISFETEQLSAFLTELKKKTLDASEEFEETVKFEGQEYTFARGGIHNVISNKHYHSDDEYIIVDADVTAYYVKTILENDICPAHLDKKAFKSAYQWIYDERTRLKPLAKKGDDELKGIVAGYKEAGVSVYGKMGDATNWLFDIQGMLTTCITGELSILMLIEAQHLIGNQCIMANTDGATFLVKRSEVNQFYEICNSWKVRTKYELEYFNIKDIWFSNVNHYLAIYDDYTDPVFGKVKRKGLFSTFSELHKNKSFRIIALALYEYFVNDVDPEQFINGYDRIFDFCKRASAGDDFYNATFIDNEEVVLPKLLRYYVAREGVNIIKMVKPGAPTNANDTTVQPKDYPKVICNSLPKETHKKHLENINRQWYIDQANEIIYAIERGKKPKRGKLPDKNQLTLF